MMLYDLLDMADGAKIQITQDILDRQLRAVRLIGLVAEMLIILIWQYVYHLGDAGPDNKDRK